MGAATDCPDGSGWRHCHAHLHHSLSSRAPPGAVNARVTLPSRTGWNPSSTVKWMLEDVAGGTRLSLEHTGLPQGAEAYGLTLALDKGWDDHLARMRADAHAD